MTTRHSIPGLVTLISILLQAGANGAAPIETPSAVISPDRWLEARFSLDTNGAPMYSVKLAGDVVLRDSHLGLVRDDADFSKGLRLISESKTTPVKDKYEILTAKRRKNNYLANRKVFSLQTASGERMDVIFQVSDDGVAFRYYFPDTKPGVRKLSEETTSFHFLPGTRAWLQPMSVAKSGWSQVNPCYEEFYEKDIPVGKPSTLGAGWVFPALFRSGDVWVAITEGSLPRNYCGTRLKSESPDGEYSVGFPDQREGLPDGAVNPESTLPWLTPWRIVAIGSLKTIVNSTLGTDLADKPAESAGSYVKPGKAAWSWPLKGDSQTSFAVQKRFIDYAAEMGWRYCLIDALWDKQIGFDNIRNLAWYGRGKGVSLLLWYNSAGTWNSAPQTPRNMMLTHESRIHEFQRLKDAGIAGVKIDFFGGDGQSMIDYYLDILADAAQYKLMVNFHGATLPRGWERTYPQLMTMEAVRGLEYVTFEQTNADAEPTHAAMLPFTRNLFDPMDFTPMVLDSVPRIQRRTTSAFELALSVLFTSGIQHYAEIPDGMAKTPDYVREFIRDVPSVWDDSRFVDGYPGKLVVIARKGDGHWYVAGINGESTGKDLNLDLKDTGVHGRGMLITDGDRGNLSFRQEPIDVGTDGKVSLSVLPQGGFVIVF